METISVKSDKERIYELECQVKKLAENMMHVKRALEQVIETFKLFKQ